MDIVPHASYQSITILEHLFLSSDFCVTKIHDTDRVDNGRAQLHLPKGDSSQRLE